MICFHFLYDLNFFSIISVNLYQGVFYPIAYGTASLFILLFGISLTLKWGRISQILDGKDLFLSYFLRGIRILILGLVITLVTYWYIPHRFIIFGILHFIGVSLIISFPFIRYKNINIILGLIFLFSTYGIRMIMIDGYWGVFLGIPPPEFTTVDYFPLFPWFGVVLLGIALGNILYENGIRQFKITEYSSHSIIRFICFLGKNSLIIYFFHQPILFFLIWVFIS